MADTPIPIRLVPILGESSGGVGVEQLRDLVGLREGDDLEVKEQTYGAGDSAKRELCADVASFANGRGGVLLVGASEVDDEITALAPIAVAGEELRIRGVLTAGITPPVTLDIRVLTDGGSDGYILINIPPSATAPHAVVKDQDLRYPVRDGAGKRWMREPEVADRYRGRFASAASRIETLDSVDSAIRQRYAIERNVWLVVSGVPDIPGRLSISLSGKRETQQWATDQVRDAPTGPAFSNLPGQVTTGFRRYVVGDFAAGDAKSRRAVAELHVDGSASVALVVGWQAKGGFDEEDDTKPLTVWDTGLAVAILQALQLLGRHAARSGAAGGLSVVATLEGASDFDLGHTRFHGFPERVMGTRVLADVERAAHTFDIADLVDPVRLTAAAALVAADLLSAFGFADCLQLSLDGEIRRNYIDRGHESLIAWAESHGVPVTDDTVDS